MDISTSHLLLGPESQVSLGMELVETTRTADCPQPGLRAGSLCQDPLFISLLGKRALSSHPSPKPRST